jgi:hypothetical protein
MDLHVESAFTTNEYFLAVLPLTPQDMYKYSFKKALVSDPSTYPLIVALAGTALFTVGMTVNAFMHYKDIRINPAHKHQVIRDWGMEPTKYLVYKWGRDPIGPHAKDYKKIQHEGLGIDHKEWQKAKDAEMAAIMTGKKQ